MNCVRITVALVVAGALAACGDSGDRSSLDADAPPVAQSPAPPEPEPVLPFQELYDQGVDRYLGVFTPMLSQAADGGAVTHLFGEGNGPLCFTGNPFSMSTRDGSSDALLIFVQGGGFCGPDACEAVENPIPLFDIGLLSAADQNNPASDFNLGYIPYCDGTSFTGDRDLDTNGDGTNDRFFRGVQNLSAALDVIASTYPAPSRILLAGNSAGGFATHSALPLVRRLYPGVAVDLINDSGVGILPPGSQDELNEYWNAANTYPASCTDCIGDDGNLTGYHSYQLAEDDNLRMGFLSSTADEVILSSSSLGPVIFENALREAVAELETAWPDRFRSLINEGEEHTFILRRFDFEIGDTTVREWIANMLARSTDWISVSEERIDPITVNPVAPGKGASETCRAQIYPISASLDPGLTNTGLYETVAPFEHADVGRSHLYRADFGGSLTSPLDNAVQVREYDGIHEAPYNIVTRDREELFIYGGTQGEREEAEGPYVVKLDAKTREVVWRTDLRDTKALGEFLWPGLVTVHGNGDLYAIYGTRLARLDPRDGSVKLEVELPTPAGTIPEDINYNGFTVLESGVIVTKSFGRPAGCTDQGVDAFQNCVSEDNPLPPSVVVSVDPDSLDVLDTYQLGEGAGGRLTRAEFEGREYVYVPGDTTIVRFEVDDAGALSLDEGWSVADYLDEGQTPASAPIAMGDWIVFQTNASSSSSPLSVFAVAQADASVRLEAKPFSQGFPPVSFIPSALTVDPDNLRIYPMDTGRGQIASIELVDGERLETRWVVDQVTLNHTSLAGPVDARVFVATDAPDLLSAILGQAAGYKEQVVWRSAETGEQLARSEFLSPMLPGDPLAPGFFGVWFYPGADGTLLELEVEGPELAACREAQADDGA